MADPHGRLKRKLRYSPTFGNLGACAPAYRAADVFLGNQRYSEDLTGARPPREGGEGRALF
eukprot:5083346-Pyramimonas_sp.AAC.1